jgi:acetylornithine/succinyldiaminopimelate/putrescine aminotransferase
MINNISRSLCDLLGEPYIDSVCRSRSVLTGENIEALKGIATEKIEFFPKQMVSRLDELAYEIGRQLVPPSNFANDGAPSAAIHAASRNEAAPLSALGCYRIGEDGRLYFTAKSEHYHIPLGHSFPGYMLIENAKRLGITNATHNNTRGFVTRLLERELIRTANGIDKRDEPGLNDLLLKNEPGTVNRVINLETGSLAVEAALKMMLARFYQITQSAVAQYHGRTPVFLVMGDYTGNTGANYHGTTILEQTMRGHWKDLYQNAEKASLYKVVPVNINDIDDFAQKIEKYNTGDYKTAGFCHEIILMNYGGIHLSESYLHEAYRLCRSYDTPVLCDEIQSCAWYSDLYLFRRYGLTPDFVSIGKGFPGGNYSASKILFSGAFDNLIQFGALVTNGQEELASLSYLITMEFLKANKEHIDDTGRYYMQSIQELGSHYPGITAGVEGDSHMVAIRFAESAQAEAFCRYMNAACFDVSVQSYKPNCPPIALTKIPLITSRNIIDAILRKMQDSLETIRKECA